jgi:hypothetical protein
MDMDKGSIASVMREVQHQTDQIEASADLDSWLENEAGGKLRKREKQSADDLKSALEAEFLTPSPRFSAEWLNRLQRCVPAFPGGERSMYCLLAALYFHLLASAFGIGKSNLTLFTYPTKADGTFL